MNRTIFVLGAPRSGTTLLINMLVMNQSKIFGSTEESQFYTTTLRAPYSIETFLSSSFFNKLLSENESRDLFNRSANHIEFFRNTISYCLEREKKQIFVEKSPMHTLFYENLKSDFENVSFMIIKRNSCANVQSIAFTKWIPLSSDFLPGFLRNNKSIRYFFATLHMYKYWCYTKAIEKDPACILSINYEDIILENLNMKEELQKALGFELDELFVSRPFSDAVSHKNYGLDKSRVYDYKNVMPANIQYFINSIFNPTTFFQKLYGKIVIGIFFEPLLLFRKLLRS